MSASASLPQDIYISPFAWRYGSPEMRQLWSETEKRRLWRRAWVALAAAEEQAGLVSREQVAELRAHQEQIDLARSQQIEEEIRHDLMAELRCFAEQCPTAGRIIHLGATSMDIEDNAEALRLRAGLDLLLERLRTLLLALAGQIEQNAGVACLGFTHLQAAEPTTVGYRLASYGQDLLADWNDLVRARAAVRGKGFKGAVGTGAAFGQLLTGSGVTPAQLEARAMKELGLEAYPVANQVYPRRQDWVVLTSLAGAAATIYRLAFDVRLLQSPLAREWAEPFGAFQVGSSAMPFKRNPINAENLDSLARYLAALPRVAWDNAANNLLERTLDDSANRRIILPEAFLCADELLLRAGRLLQGLQLDERAMAHNLAEFGVFAASERLLMEAVKAGGDRQALHEVIREHSLAAWEALRQGRPNPLADRLCADPRITRWLDAGTARGLLDATGYTGDAAERARALAGRIREALR